MHTKYDDRVAVVVGEESWTYSDVNVEATGYAKQVLQACQSTPVPSVQSKIQNGPRVAVMAEPGAEYVAGMWAAWLAGGVAVPLALANPAAELLYVLEDSKVSVVLVTKAYSELLKPLAAKCGAALIRLEPVLAVSRMTPVAKAISEYPGKVYVGGKLMNTHKYDEAALKSIALPKPSNDKGALIIYTSGTTGRPKGALHSHKGLQAQCKSMGGAWGWCAEDRILHVLPLHHIHGIVNAFITPLMYGAAIEFMPKFSPSQMWERVVQQPPITVFMGVPTMYNFLLNAYSKMPPAKQQAGAAAMRALRLTISGSAACPLPIMNGWKEITGQVLLERYGMTETGMILSNPYSPSDSRRPGFVGAPLPGQEIKMSVVCSLRFHVAQMSVVCSLRFRVAQMSAVCSLRCHAAQMSAVCSLRFHVAQMSALCSLRCHAAQMRAVCSLRFLVAQMRAVCSLRCHVAQMSALCSLRCHAAQMSAVCSLRFHVAQMSVVCSLHCHAAQMSAVCSLHYHVAQMSVVCSLRFHVAQMSVVCSLRFRVAQMSAVCSLRCHAAQMSALCSLRCHAAQMRAMRAVCSLRFHVAQMIAMSALCSLRFHVAQMSAVCSLRCHAAQMSAVCSLRFHVAQMSALCLLRCHAVQMSAMSAVRSLRCHVAQMSALCSLRCHVAQMSVVCSLRCHATQMSAVCSLRFHVAQMSALCSLRCHAAQMSAVCSLRFHVAQMSVMSVVCSLRFRVAQMSGVLAALPCGADECAVLAALPRGANACGVLAALPRAQMSAVCSLCCHVAQMRAVCSLRCHVAQMIAMSALCSLRFHVAQMSAVCSLRCHAAQMSAVCSLRFHVAQMSALCLLRCHAVQMSAMSAVRSLRCHVAQMSALCSLRCHVAQMSVVCSLRCHATQMSAVCSLRFHVAQMSVVCSLRRHVAQMSAVCSLHYHVAQMSVVCSLRFHVAQMSVVCSLRFRVAQMSALCSLRCHVAQMSVVCSLRCHAAQMSAVCSLRFHVAQMSVVCSLRCHVAQMSAVCSLHYHVAQMSVMSALCSLRCHAAQMRCVAALLTWHADECGVLAVLPRGADACGVLAALPRGADDCGALAALLRGADACGVLAALPRAQMSALCSLRFHVAQMSAVCSLRCHAAQMSAVCSLRFHVAQMNECAVLAALPRGANACGVLAALPRAQMSAMSAVRSLCCHVAQMRAVCSLRCHVAQMIALCSLRCYVAQMRAVCSLRFHVAQMSALCSLRFHVAQMSAVCSLHCHAAQMSAVCSLHYHVAQMSVVCSLRFHVAQMSVVCSLRFRVAQMSAVCSLRCHAEQMSAVCSLRFHVAQMSVVCSLRFHVAQMNACGVLAVLTRGADACGVLAALPHGADECGALAAPPCGANACGVLAALPRAQMSVVCSLRFHVAQMSVVCSLRFRVAQMSAVCSLRCHAEQMSAVCSLRFHVAQMSVVCSLRFHVAQMSALCSLRCHAAQMRAMRAVCSLRCHVAQMSAMSAVCSLRFHVAQMSVVCSLRFHVAQMSALCSLRCHAAQMRAMRAVCSLRCHVAQMSAISAVCSLRCHVAQMSAVRSLRCYVAQMRAVCSLRFHVAQMSALCSLRCHAAQMSAVCSLHYHVAQTSVVCSLRFHVAQMSVVCSLRFRVAQMSAVCSLRCHAEQMSAVCSLRFHVAQMSVMRAVCSLRCHVAQMSALCSLRCHVAQMSAVCSLRCHAAQMSAVCSLHYHVAQMSVVCSLRFHVAQMSVVCSLRFRVAQMSAVCSLRCHAEQMSAVCSLRFHVAQMSVVCSLRFHVAQMSALCSLRCHAAQMRAMRAVCSLRCHVAQMSVVCSLRFHVAQMSVVCSLRFRVAQMSAVCSLRCHAEQMSAVCSLRFHVAQMSVVCSLRFHVAQMSAVCSLRCLAAQMRAVCSLRCHVAQMSAMSALCSLRFHVAQMSLVCSLRCHVAQMSAVCSLRCHVAQMSAMSALCSLRFHVAQMSVVCSLRCHVAQMSAVVPEGEGTPEDGPGEIRVRGELIFTEYFGRPDATKAAHDEEGYFKTGDIVKKEDGSWRILGRNSVDIIKCGGYKLSALEIENHLLDHPAIEECAVCGVPDEAYGELVGLVAAPKQGETLPSLKELGSWAASHMASYKIPKLMKGVSAIPRNAMGKVNKKELVKIFGMAAPAPPPTDIYVINGFFMAMREKYTKAGASIHYFVVEWSPASLAWEDFRGKVLGATDPATAEAGSLRAEVLAKYKALGLTGEPNVGDNGVHASASPFEALAERLNWVGAALEEDAFGAAMLKAGIPKDTIMAWTKDPQARYPHYALGTACGSNIPGVQSQRYLRWESMPEDSASTCLNGEYFTSILGVMEVEYFWRPLRIGHGSQSPCAVACKGGWWMPLGHSVRVGRVGWAWQVEFEGKKQSLFDLLEDINADECLAKCQKIAGVSGPVVPVKNMAYVFIKPHAVTPAVVELVSSKFQAAGISVGQSGAIDNTKIEKDMLVDNHYYAIANKASLSKPADLNPPAAKQEDFKAKFGLSWAEALQKGWVYNAVDGCAKLGIDGEAMDTRWAQTKKAGDLVKFGGGFYCGKLSLPWGGRALLQAAPCPRDVGGAAAEAGGVGGGTLSGGRRDVHRRGRDVGADGAHAALGCACGGSAGAAPAPPPTDIYVINGFFMAMREKYTKAGASIHYFLVEWSPASLAWEDFRGKVLGATDPATAEAGSLRAEVLAKYKALGLTEEPNVGDNGVHASASPFEALAERLNWVGAALEEDAFGAAMLKAGIPKDTIMAWTKDPQARHPHYALGQGVAEVMLRLLGGGACREGDQISGLARHTPHGEGVGASYSALLDEAYSTSGDEVQTAVEFEGKKQSLFDLLEDINADECLAKCQKIAGVSGPVVPVKNMAYVFIKPHAVTPAVVELVASKFQAAGISVGQSGAIDNTKIEKDMLVDNHYYAIANKASLSKPADLNPPAAKQEDFKAKFGLSWAEALQKGWVYNAVDGCAKLGIDGEAMDTRWAQTKKAGDLVKFGGGFYCGKLSLPWGGRALLQAAPYPRDVGGAAAEAGGVGGGTLSGGRRDVHRRGRDVGADGAHAALGCACGGSAGAAPAPPPTDIYVINGFFMAMREKYTKAGASIHYFVVEWSPASLAWEDFRGKVLGATDPATAEAGSLRVEVLAKYKALGLTEEPNVGDNGVHASASPFEALAERLNWVGATLEEDAFGAAMLKAGIPKDTIMAWTKDPQARHPHYALGQGVAEVMPRLLVGGVCREGDQISGLARHTPHGEGVGASHSALLDEAYSTSGDEVQTAVEFEGKKQSLFDLLEDINADECLAKCQKIAGVSGPVVPVKNMAYVFIKPHAVTPAVVELVSSKFQAAGISVGQSGAIDNTKIEKDMLVDNHYYAIANKASLSKPADLNPPAAKQEDFKAKFGLSWAEALQKGWVYNAVDGCAKLGIDGEAMDTRWAQTKKAGDLVKFGGGFYCGKLSLPWGGRALLQAAPYPRDVGGAAAEAGGVGGGTLSGGRRDVHRRGRDVGADGAHAALGCACGGSAGAAPAPPPTDIYVLNGFFMAMREKYTKAGASIHYFVVEWSPASLAWEDFRGKVLGATDPATAEAGSLRAEVLAKYKALGLTEEPNVGDNGVHASASPFEALAERLNWVGAALEEDAFGAAMLKAGIPKDTIMAWTKDPQARHPHYALGHGVAEVMLRLLVGGVCREGDQISGLARHTPHGEGVGASHSALLDEAYSTSGDEVQTAVEFEGKKQSLFDLLEDINADECLAKCQKIAGVSGPVVPVKNMAYVFIKPHAVTPAVVELVSSKFQAAGISVGQSGAIDNTKIEKDMLVDNHYYAIANKASLSKPADLNPPAAKQEDFKAKFGLSWAEALQRGWVYNAVDGCAKLGIDGEAMDTRWAQTKKAGDLVKFGGGFYCGKLSLPWGGRALLQAAPYPRDVGGAAAEAGGVGGGTLSGGRRDVHRRGRDVGADGAHAALGCACGGSAGAAPAPPPTDIYVINGFFMAMREKYTKAGASIHYFVVEWSPASLAWEDFRGKVLGATDPATAEAGSLRAEVLAKYKALGLTEEPNVGDNGVHASASPFEALAERLNWVGATLEEDAFGAAMLKAGIPKDTIMAWTKDPQARHPHYALGQGVAEVMLRLLVGGVCREGDQISGLARHTPHGEGVGASHSALLDEAYSTSGDEVQTAVEFEGKKQSLFDLLEDINADECLAKCQKIAGVSGPVVPVKNMAYVFIKPHAVTPAVVELVSSKFQAAGISVGQSGAIDNTKIEKDMLVDNHYYAIANKASLSKPADLNPPAAKQEDFKAKFGLSWAEALQRGWVYNAVDGCAKLGIDGEAMDTRWAQTKKAGDLVKFGGGFYCGKLSLPWGGRALLQAAPCPRDVGGAAAEAGGVGGGTLSGGRRDVHRRGRDVGADGAHAALGCACGGSAGAAPAPPPTDIYVINGFFMAMREKYTKAGASIHYFVVEWSPASLAWEDFRGKVLGATDPATAEAGSLRAEVLAKYKALGLTEEPNVGDNGVHASASPFEALAERLNWVGATLEEDAFGAAMLKAGIPKDTIMAWTKDPQARHPHYALGQGVAEVMLRLLVGGVCREGDQISGLARHTPHGEGVGASHSALLDEAYSTSGDEVQTAVEFEGKKQSLFDLLEDINADECLAKCQKIAGVSGPVVPVKNMAYVFIKPHAVTPAVVELVSSKFQAAGISVGQSGAIDNTKIEKDMLVDNHYYAIANKASLSKPADLNPPAAKQEDFKAKFGLSWAEALQKGWVYNAVDGCAKLGIDGEAMDTRWAQTKKAGDLVKFGGGFYCGKLSLPWGGRALLQAAPYPRDVGGAAAEAGGVGGGTLSGGRRDVHRRGRDVGADGAHAALGCACGGSAGAAPAPPPTDIYVINGFFMAMREKYTKAGASIHYFVVEWSPASLAWEDFRGKVLGATDPATAEAGSLRVEVLAKYKALGLTEEPNVGDNGVHASASPFEALAERLNWVGAALEEDAFGAAMLKAGIPKDTIMAWTKDPQARHPHYALGHGVAEVMLRLLVGGVCREGDQISGLARHTPHGEGVGASHSALLDEAYSTSGDEVQTAVEFEGKKQSLFDLLEDINADECLAKCQKIAGVSGPVVPVKNMAYVFIKPHAVTPAVVELVSSKFQAAGISVGQSGAIDNTKIEKDMLVDNHYYAIANKASLSKPADLNPPAAKQEDFKAKFGLSWAEALQKGWVYNAVDGCAKLGIDGEAMDTRWAQTKKAGDLVKFGGGFYCGKLSL
ncbi:hypothetical protein CYMTET_12043 [Cymbomonas tetramitiformis]|uniref:AMP-dependent synthetase/ligase domain-containing protein n=1 Tax=Cymbomonas tetramitiformis TaxID=36881 RepID=A0AAE0GL17_9CHLO|nr:hypothetical protein CYMTET_12043 [Cymbomonas tetramitiformis]